MADYVVQYSTDTKKVLGMWLRTTSDNISTCETDGYIEVDGVRVVAPLGPEYRSDLDVVLISAPTDTELEIVANVLEVDDGAVPTDVTFRTDTSRNPEYAFP